MSDATNLQTSFLGGAITAVYQGRADAKKYAEGLNVCFNALPLETGAWTRRPGTRIAAFTCGGVFGRIVSFDFAAASPYQIEFTDGNIRFFSGYSLVHTYDPQVVASISTANPAVVTIGAGANVPAGWANGDQVEFSITLPNLTPENGALLQGRQFTLNNKSGATFTLFDSVTGAGIDGSTLNFTAGTPTLVQHVLNLTTSYRSVMLQQIRGIQAQNNNNPVMVLLHPSIAPNVISSNNPPNPVFVINAASFTDGPYLDIPTDGSTLTPSATSGTITVTSSIAQFASTDVGRHVRLLSQPPVWAAGTGYTAGQQVTYNSAYYVALVNNTGNIPGADTTNWAVSTNAAQWGWGTITVFTDATHVTVLMKTPLLNTNATAQYRLGTYSTTTGWPSAGCYHEGRLWLSGYLGNRIDGSSVGQPGGIFNFSPTAPDGSVSDANAISYTFNFKDINAIFWMTPQQTGILCGTQAGEILVQASSNSDVLTPTSIQAKKVTRYGSANVEPIDAPFATLIVERNNRKVLEYLADVFTGKYTGINVSLTGSQFIKSGVAEIKYQRELCPVAWVRNNDGSFVGMTYRRESPMLSEQPAFSGWHNHALGTGRTINSISVGPSVGGNLDTLSMVTFDPADGLYRVELMTDIFPENGTGLDAWFVDGGTTPAGALISGTTLTIYGLSNFEGKTISFWLAGIDSGDYTVTNGQIVVNLPAGFANSGLLTQATIAAVNGVSTFSPNLMPVTYNIQNFPANTSSVQSYIGPSTPVTGINTDNIILDYKHSKLYEWKNGSTPTDGIRVFDIISGLQINQVTHDQLFGAGSFRNMNTPFCLGNDGYIYAPITSSNSVPYVRIDTNLLRIVATCGLSSSSTAPDPNSINLANNMCAVTTNDGRGQFIICPSILGAQATINILDVTYGMALAGHSFAMTEGVGYSCQGAMNTGTAFTVANSGTAIGLYKTVISPGAVGWGPPLNFPTVQNPGIVTTKIAAIAAASIDATWTHVNGTAAKGATYDNSDDNLLMFVSTIDSVATQQYLIKINSATGAVMWKIAFLTVNNQSVNMPASYAAFNQFSFLGVGGGTSIYHAINTSSGTSVDTAIPGFNLGNSCLFDARIGGIFGNYGFSSTGGSPTLLNATPSTFNQQWCRLLVNADLTPATGRQFYIVPAAVGTTYTSQGQRLRVLSPAESGARNGPALGKNRRNHRLAMLLNSTAGIAYGTDFVKMHPAKFTTKPGNAQSVAANVLFSGVFSTTLEDSDTYDGMQAWQIVRPYPATILAAASFLETQDK